MATRKRNEWLDAEESEEENAGYDSEEESKTKNTLLRTAKRQKVEHDSEIEDGDDDNDEEPNQLEQRDAQSEISAGEDEIDDIAAVQPVSRSRFPPERMTK